jgi:hypothetical protein
MGRWGVGKGSEQGRYGTTMHPTCADMKNSKVHKRNVCRHEKILFLISTNVRRHEHMAMFICTNVRRQGELAMSLWARTKRLRRAARDKTGKRYKGQT